MSDFKMTEEQKALFDALTRLQQEISINSLSGMNDIDAYKNSSGKAKKEETMRASVSEILTNPKVKAFLDSMKEVAVSNAIMTRDEMLEELSQLSRTNVTDIIEFGYRPVEAIDEETGEKTVQMQSYWTMRPSNQIAPEHLKAIEEVTSSKEGLKFKKVSRLAAMNQLADLAGYKAAQKHDHTVKAVNMEISENTSPQDAANIYKSLLGE